MVLNVWLRDYLKFKYLEYLVCGNEYNISLCGTVVIVPMVRPNTPWFKSVTVLITALQDEILSLLQLFEDFHLFLIFFTVYYRVFFTRGNTTKYLITGILLMYAHTPHIDFCAQYRAFFDY
jgi:hypothetical protein